MISTISRNELIERLDRGCDFALVETLPSTAYHQARLPGAINLPPDQISELAATLLPDKTIEIIVYGASPTCLDSQNAASELAALGYANVRNYAGGKKDWFDAGLRIEVI
ncbi:MAG: rhodanese-like domain-containing protein [Acidobacteriota bacterium]